MREKKKRFAQSIAKTSSQTKKQPFVSICTVTYNRAEFLPLLEACIYRQTYPHALLEWVIVDDSDDVTSAFQPDQSKGLNICYQRLESKHVLGKKRNLSNSFCRGDIIVYMDDDDYYPKERVAHAVEKLTGSEDILMAACSKIPILFLPERELWVSGPYGINHGTANTFAFKRQLLDQTSFNDLESLAEERHFLKDYTIPMVQLEPTKTILCMAHGSNTYEKRKFTQVGNNKRFQRYSSEGLVKLEPVISAYANVSMTREQKQNRLLIEKKKIISAPLFSSWDFLAAPECFVVSFEANHACCLRTTNHLAELGLNPHVCLGATPDTLIDYVQEDSIPPSSKPAALACLVSHLLAIRYALDHSANDPLLIVEDDIYLFSDPVAKGLDQIIDSNHWDILQLGTNNPDAQKYLNFLHTKDKLISRWVTMNWSTGAYLIKREYASKLLIKYSSQSHEPLFDFSASHSFNNSLADRLLYQSGDCLTFNYPLVCNLVDYNSNIGYSNVVKEATQRQELYVLNLWANELNTYSK